MYSLQSQILLARTFDAKISERVIVEWKQERGKM